jgi:asparagine synthase (glutamine-hydrolysing)
MSSSSKAKDPIEEDSALYNGTLRPASPELQRGEQAQSDKYKERTFSNSLSGLKLNIIYLDDLDLGSYLEKTIKLVGTDNRLITDLNVPLYIILEEIEKHGFDKLFLGQGADTLFGGFARYPFSENFGSEIIEDIKNIGKTNLVHNYKIFDHFKMKPIYPFLEKNVVDFAVKTDPGLKIRDGVQKYILREAFREYLPENIVDLPKKSFQYGSGIHKALRKFSKKN